MINRFPTKINALSYIKEFLNDEINTIIDVGILTSTIELMTVFKHKKHVLIEPLEEYSDVIAQKYDKAEISYDLLQLAASNQKGQQKLEKRNHLPTLGQKYGNVTASNLIFDDSELKENQILVETDTIDNIKNQYTGPFLVKIDVDGAEFEILEGLAECDDVFVIVVESWLSRISQLQNVMSEKGFILYDITDLCYMRGQLSQVDLIFVNTKIMHNERYQEITPRDFGYSPAQSGNYVPFKEEILMNEEKMAHLLEIVKTGRPHEGESSVCDLNTE